MQQPLRARQRRGARAQVVRAAELAVVVRRRQQIVVGRRPADTYTLHYVHTVPER